MPLYRHLGGSASFFSFVSVGSLYYLRAVFQKSKK